MFWAMHASQVQYLNPRLLIVRLTHIVFVKPHFTLLTTRGSSPFRLCCGPSVVLGAEIGGVFGLVWGFGGSIACLIFWGDGWVVFLCCRALEA